MTKSQGLKRLGAPVAALLAIVLVALLAVSWLLDRDALRRAVEAQIHAVTGLQVAVDGRVDISVFPGSSIIFHDVRLISHDSDAAPALTVAQLAVNMRFLPLLAKQFEIADVTMRRPTIHVTVGPDRESNWTPLVDAISRLTKADSQSELSFSEVRVEDGTLTYQTPQTVEVLNDIDLSLAWPSISRSFGASGQFDWRGERIDGTLSISDFVAALNGDRSGLKVRIASQPLKMAFDGSIANRASMIMEGTLTADSPALRSALRWIGHPPPGNGGFGRFSMKARTSVVGSAIALTNVNLELDGNAAEGVMSFSNTGRQTLQATLAAGALDLTPYIPAFRLIASGARDWNRQLFGTRALSGTDLDMRLSAAKVTLGSTNLGRTALGANLRAGALALSIGEAQVFGGIVRGTFAVNREDELAKVRTQFQFVDVELQACTKELFGFQRLSGRGNLSLTLEAEGTSAFGLAQSLDGSATLTGQNGAISGFNAEQLLKRLERRPLSGGGSFRTGQTPFNNLSVALRFHDGIATVQDVKIDGPATKLTLTGTASMPAREYDLKGVATLVQSGNAQPGFSLPFVVQGPWDDPLVYPDPESLIRRSPASAPLLDAVKDRKTRETIRSVIERFTGLPKPLPAKVDETSADKPPATVTDAPAVNPAPE